MKYRIGNGLDAHRFTEGRPLILGGIEIAFPMGLAGHSDADVLTHAIIDALLGAAALDDIGTHFPDDDPRYRNINSILLLRQVLEMLTQRGYKIGNLDTVIVAQEPKLQPHIPAIRQHLAREMNLPITDISVKAKTTEGMGFTGRGEGILSMATVLLFLP